MVYHHVPLLFPFLVTPLFFQRWFITARQLIPSFWIFFFYFIFHAIKKKKTNKHVFLTPAWDCPCPLQSFRNSYDLEAWSIKLLNPVSLESAQECSALCMVSSHAGIPGEGWLWYHCMCWTGTGITGAGEGLRLCHEGKRLVSAWPL